MTASELSELVAFDRLEPIGEFRADVRSGIIASTIANTNRIDGADPFGPLDFMPWADKPPPRELSPADIEAELNRRFGK